jgi:uncharacterized protein (TIGR02646 family)
MRELYRPTVALPTLSGTGVGARTAAKHVKAYAENAVAPRTFPKYWTNPDVRGALRAMHGGACAFCQGHLPHNDLGDVEHFRPRKPYWWLAYEFSNLLLACRSCNSFWKVDKFPLLEGVERCSFEQRDHLCEERSLLLDPTTDDVEQWLSVDWDSDSCFIDPAEHLDRGSDPWRRTQKTIELFRLNLDAELIKERIEAIGLAEKLLDAALAGDAVMEEGIKGMASRFMPFSLGIRQMLVRRARHLLPSPEDDLQRFVLDLLFLLNLKRDPKTGRRLPEKDKALRRRRKEVLWALAVLWHDPPVGSPKLVEDCLATSDWQAEVAALKSRL